VTKDLSLGPGKEFNGNALESKFDKEPLPVAAMGYKWSEKGEDAKVKDHC